MIAHRFACSALFALASLSGPLLSAQIETAPVEVMVLGTYHMHNPGVDEANIVADDVLSPRRQAELERTARRLAEFRPTKIAVERTASAADFIWSDSLDPEQLKTSRNEIHQLGQRLALIAGISRLHGVDAPGDFNLDPIRRLDQRVTGGTRMQAWDARLQAFAATLQHRLDELPIDDYLIWLNRADTIAENHSFYPALLPIAEGEEQPAAKLVTNWYERNARIWSKICQIARPGDRIVVLFGAGHAYWLRRHAVETPGFRLIEPTDFLQRR